jgi:RsiW-degrading membrane proteinase PrsW (M82 family)
MTIWILLSGIVGPAIFWIGYFYYRDRFQPEPLKTIGMSYILGILSGLLCYQFYRLLPIIGIPDDPSALMEGNRLQFFGYSLFIIGIFEEFFKYLPFVFIIMRWKAFDEKTDGIIYASMVALGFASFENLFYLRYMEGLELLGRAFASPLTHSIFSSIWGYFCGLARIQNKSVVKASLKGLVLAAVFHGIFDFLTTSSALRVVSSLLILMIWIWRMRILERSTQEGRKNVKALHR